MLACSINIHLGLMPKAHISNVNGFCYQSDRVNIILGLEVSSRQATLTNSHLFHLCRAVRLKPLEP